MGVRGELFSTKVSSEKRTYFFNVKENRVGDVFLNIVESKKDGETDFERHQIMVYEEEIDMFMRELQKAAAILQKRREVERPSRSRPPRSHSEPGAEAAPRKKIARVSKNGEVREPPRPTYELDGQWKGPESMKAVGGKVARISRKDIEARNAKKASEEGSASEDSTNK